VNTDVTARRKREEDPKMKWEREVERVMKLKNPATANAVHW
jgi:hypothetical protein